MSLFDFEWGPEGPRIRPNIWPFNHARRGSLQDWMTAQLRTISRDREINAAARRGIPRVCDTVPSAKQLEITATHRLKRDELEQEAEARLAEIHTELGTLGVDVTASELSSISSGLAGRLDETGGGVMAALAPALSEKIEAEARLRAFEDDNCLDNEPTARSAAIWLATSALTATIEALVNGLLFRDELGYGPGVAFAFLVGVAFAGLGTFAGIGAAQLKRPPVARKLAGGLWLILMIAIVGFFLLGMGHYRAALAGGAPQAVEAARASLANAPWSPLADFSLFPYLVVNILGIVVVAWKAVPMFGFLDLKRHQKAYEKAVRRVEALINHGLATCGEAQEVALADTDAIVERTLDNSRRGKEFLGQGAQVIDGLARDNERLRDSQRATDQKYREKVLGVHPAARELQFVDPELLLDVDLVLDQSWHAIASGLDARSVKVREALPGMIESIYEAVNAAKERIISNAVELEAELRRGGVQWVVRMRGV